MNLLINFMRLHGDVNESNVKIVQLGVDRLVGCISDIAFVLIISAIFNMFWEGVLFEFIFILIRSYAGGYHAESKKKCVYMSMFSTLFCLMIIHLLKLDDAYWIILCIAAWLVICIYAPIESKNKPLCEKEKKVFGNRAKIISTIFLLAAGILFLGKSVVLKPISVSMCSVAVGMLMTFMNNRERISTDVWYKKT